MEFRILGSLEVSRAGRPVELAGRKQRALLAVFLLNANRVVAGDRLVEILWGDEPPATAVHTLHVHVSQLRKALKEGDSSGRITTQTAGYRLEVDVDELDLTEFEHLVAAGRQALSQGSAGNALEAFERALRLWRGPALAELGSEPFATRERGRLEELRMTALEGRFEAELARGLHTRTITELQPLAAEHPLRQRLQAQLMLALYRSGRQAEASDVFQRLRTRLRDELGMEPGPELQALLRQILTHDSALQVAAGSAKVGNLPVQLTGFIGRKPAVAKLRRLLRDHRLVTLLGVGGVGKTRLALEAASELAGEEHALVWFVDFSSLFDPALLPDTIAATLGITQNASEPIRVTLLERLSVEPALLVLDNCEHLAAGCADTVLELLQGTTSTRFLVTSRQPLQVSGEVTWPVPPMTLPAAGGASIRDALRESEAVQLFDARARAVDIDFSVGAENVEAVVNICRRLDGIPLAIELAAALVRGMSPAEIDDRLGDQFALLSESATAGAPRHRSLGTTLDWSHQMLSERQRILFRRLAIFAGSFDLAAPEAVCRDEVLTRPEIAKILLQLVDRSLVVREGHLNGRTRYRLLETVRAYAREKLHESGERRVVAARHAEHIRDRAEAAWCAYPNTLVQHAELKADIDDIRASLEWCCAEVPALGMQVLGALGFFILNIGYHREGRDWLDKLRAAAHGKVEVPTRTLTIEARLQEAQGDYEMALATVEVALAQSRRDEDRLGEAEAQLEMGGIEINLGRYGQARSRLRKSLALFKQLGERRQIGRVLNEMGLMAWRRGHLHAAQRNFEACLVAVGSDWEAATLAVPVGNLGAVTFDLGDLVRSRSLTEQSLGVAREHGMRPTIAATLGTLGDIELTTGDHAAASRCYSEALELAAELGFGDLVIENMEGLAVVAHVRGDGVAAMRLLGAAAASRARLQLRRKPAREIQVERVAMQEKEAARDSAETDWQLGAALETRDAVRYALGLQGTESAPASALQS
jgi:predicted ATPase/DNA-binding SARP family transcriptional activator